MIELGGREILLAPRSALVERHVRAPIVPLDHAVWVVRRDPHVVVVAVRRVERLRERLPAVARAEEAHVERVHHVRVARVGIDVRVVPRALAELPLVIHELPRGAGSSER